jgi:hypothetical protein
MSVQYISVSSDGFVIKWRKLKRNELRAIVANSRENLTGFKNSLDGNNPTARFEPGIATSDSGSPSNSWAS